MNLTLLVCNYNTALETHNLLKSLKITSSSLPKVVVMNTSTEADANQLLLEDGVPHFNYRGGIHGEGVNLGFGKVTTRYALLVDSDVILLKDFLPAFERFKEGGFALMGKVVGDVGGKTLYERVEPWFCFIDLKQLKDRKITFFDSQRTKDSRGNGGKVYDVGSTMFEDVQKAGLLIADVDLEGKYFKHYGGMSWRCQKYKGDDVDTDIDFGGTHPHKILWEIGMQVKKEYDEETKKFDKVEIKDTYNNG